MKFGDFLLSQMIPEWGNAYLNYNLLKKLIGPFQSMGKLYFKKQMKQGQQTVTITNMDHQLMESLKEFSAEFQILLMQEIGKINYFFQYKFMDCLNQWRIMRINISILGEIKSQVNPQFDQTYGRINKGFFIFYQELNYLNEYIKINQQGIRKIIKKYKKKSKIFEIDNEIHLIYQQKMDNSIINRNYDQLTGLISEVEEEYVNFSFSHSNNKDGRKELRNSVKEKLTSQTENFLFGFFFGISLLFLVVILFLFGSNRLEPDKNDSFFADIFPMFRGVGLLILYEWLLAWNVYGWTQFHVNYRLIFTFNDHFSEVAALMKRSAFFSLVFFIFFMWYVLLEKEVEGIKEIIFWIPKQYTPLVVWVIFIFYVFLPIDSLNGKGRKYFYRIIQNILLSPFQPMAFSVSWTSDQIISIVGPLRDLQYTICYYSSDQSEEQVKACRSSKRVSSAFIIAVIPLIIRLIQSLRQMHDRCQGKSIMTQVCSGDFQNAMKYCVSILTAIASYISQFDPNGLYYWIAFAGTSTLVSYYWDLIHDWDLMNAKSKNQMLRDFLSYPSKSYYYTAIYLNFFLRLVWTLSISPDIVTGLGIRPEIVTFFISFLQIFRRCIWNFLRVQKQHIVNVGAFAAVQEIKWPLKDVTFDNAKFKEQIANNQDNSEEHKKLLLTQVEDDLEGNISEIKNSNHVGQQEILLKQQKPKFIQREHYEYSRDMSERAKIQFYDYENQNNIETNFQDIKKQLDTFQQKIENLSLAYQIIPNDGSNLKGFEKQIKYH